MKKEIKKCIFAGTFDPPTLGHEALIEECLKIFDEVVVAILVNPAKKPYFTLEQREKMLALAFGKAVAGFRHLIKTYLFIMRLTFRC